MRTEEGFLSANSWKGNLGVAGHQADGDLSAGGKPSGLPLEKRERVGEGHLRQHPTLSKSDLDRIRSVRPGRGNLAIVPSRPLHYRV